MLSEDLARVLTDLSRLGLRAQVNRLRVAIGENKQRLGYLTVLHLFDLDVGSYRDQRVRAQVLKVRSLSQQNYLVEELLAHLFENARNEVAPLDLGNHRLLG